MPVLTDQQSTTLAKIANRLRELRPILARINDEIGARHGGAGMIGTPAAVASAALEQAIYELDHAVAHVDEAQGFGEDA
jgi:hypothetical protein